MLGSATSRAHVPGLLLCRMAKTLPTLPPFLPSLLSFSSFPFSCLPFQQTCAVPPHQAKGESDAEAPALRSSQSHAGVRAVKKHHVGWPVLPCWGGFLEKEVPKLSPDRSLLVGRHFGGKGHACARLEHPSYGRWQWGRGRQTGPPIPPVCKALNGPLR